MTAPSLPQIGVWYSNRTLAMNATTLDINLSQTWPTRRWWLRPSWWWPSSGWAVDTAASAERYPTGPSEEAGCIARSWPSTQNREVSPGYLATLIVDKMSPA